MNEAQTSRDIASDVQQRRKLLENHISVLNRNATYWGDRQKTGLAVVGFYTLSATVVMAVNLVLRENIQNVGGWIPFCVVAAVLTGIATHFVNGQRSEDPGANRAQCLRAVLDFRALERKLNSSAATEKKLQAFDRQMGRKERESVSFLTPPSRVSREVMMYTILVVVVGVYIAYEFARASGVEWQSLLNATAK